MNTDFVLTYAMVPERHRYTTRDTMLYALGVGVGQQDPLDPRALQYVHEHGLVAVPTFADTMGTGAFWALMVDSRAAIDWRKSLHGEQRLRLHAPIPVEGEVEVKSSVSGVYDKGLDKGALLCVTRTIHNAANGELLAELSTIAVLRGDGGFGGSAEGAPQPHALPKDRPADLVLDLPTRADQALLYRLSGDWNALHVDPKAARAAGFDRPILHGLCSYGVACRAVLQALCDDAPGRLLRLDVRFSAPVYPGETLRTELWREGAGSAGFRVLAAERGVTVLNNGYVEYRAAQ